MKVPWAWLLNSLNVLKVSDIDHRLRNSEAHAGSIIVPPLATVGGREFGNAPAQYREASMSSIQPNPLYSRAEIGILPCSKCGKPMRLACIEPIKTGHELRTFECPECKTTGSFAVAI
jgi:hypothetical protein